MLTQLDPRATRRSVVRDDALVVSLGAVGVVHVCHRPSGNGADPVLLADKSTWRMPPLAELTKPAWSFSRKVGMYTLRVYHLGDQHADCQGGSRGDNRSGWRPVKDRVGVPTSMVGALGTS